MKHHQVLRTCISLLERDGCGVIKYAINGGWKVYVMHVWEHSSLVVVCTQF